jgi:hypothetical protein
MKSNGSAFSKFPALKSLAATVLVMTLSGTGQVFGQVVTVNATSSGTYSIPAIWSTGVVPTNASVVGIGGGLTVQHVSGLSGISRLYVGDSTGVSSGTGTLTVSSGTITGASSAINVFVAGQTAGSVGTLNVAGGRLQATSASSGGLQAGVGAGSTGTVNISAGSISLGGGVQLGVGAGATGNMVVSGGIVTSGSATGSGIFYVGFRTASATTTGNFEQTGGTVIIDDGEVFGVGFSANSTQNVVGTSLLTGGSFTGNVRVGRVSGSGGAGSGTLTIGAEADVNGRSQAWDISGTGEIIFELGTTDAFNAVDLTAATATALVFSEAGAKLTIDGSNLVFSESYSPITLITFDPGSGPSALSKSNVVFDYVGFDPEFSPELVWTNTGLQLNLVPEPSSAVLIAVGALGMTMLRRRRGVDVTGSSC